jgi:hypothetical protein
MQHIARKFGDRVNFEDGDVEVRITTQQAGAKSIFAELLDDSEAFWTEACWQSARTWAQMLESEQQPLVS